MPLSEKCIGLSLETLFCRIVGGELTHSKKRDSAGKRIPPAVVYTTASSNKLKLDQWFPPSHIGTGENWPPESHVSKGCSLRMPIGLLWDLARRERIWQIDSETAIEPVDALAEAAKDSVSSFRNVDSVGLVVPNWFKQAQQQRLLDALSGTGIKWRLIWRPIAAATHWIEHFFAGKKLNYASRTPIGRILCLHLGLLECELTVVELVAEPFGLSVSVLPARQRTVGKRATLEASHQPGLTTDLLIRHAKLNADGLNAQAAPWRQMWATQWLFRQLADWKKVEKRKTRHDCPVAYDPPTAAIHGESIDSDVECNGIRWPAISIATARAWTKRLINMELSGRMQLDGAVITGELASVSVSTCSLGESFLGGSVDQNYVLVADSTAPADLLAIGAAEQCQRIDSRQPSFLTKLPRLQTVVSRGGEPEWISLLANDDSYVMGGQRWERPEPVRGIKIPRGRLLTLAIDHEDLENVRESQIEIPADFKPNQAAELHVTITPAQGNARIELRTVTMLKNRNPVVADLSKMTEVKDSHNEPLSPNGYLDWTPKLAPSISPRESDRNRWIAVKLAAQGLLATPPKTWDTRKVGRLRDQLRQKVPVSGKNITAIGSDGVPPDSPTLVDQIGRGCLEILNSKVPNWQSRDTVLRCLAYTSWTSPELEQFIDQKLIDGRMTDDAELRVIGNCLRSPNLVAKFLEKCSVRPNVNHIRAIAEISSYRPDALQFVSDSVVRSVYEAVTHHFTSANSFEGIDFRYETMSAAFLLRRRIFDEDFLPPDSPQAESVKQKCRLILDGVSKGQIRVLGGAVNLPNVMRQLIEYVDREGRGAFMWTG